jgi:long-chain acyl-CoA synthetase
VAVVGVDPTIFAGFISAVLNKEVSATEISNYFSDPKIRKAVVHELERIAVKRELAGYFLLPHSPLLSFPILPWRSLSSSSSST